ncbi:MAG TPA: efflux RND transporter periplasmic adaptor subunit [Chitinophagaceae bacterium]|nr:efflux RND transporter periplasmic adaptor subunit [Chitinophagaceae bacterium]
MKFIYNIKLLVQLLVFCVAVLPPALLHAHEGEEHGKEKRGTTGAASYFSSEAVSDKYELLVKYGELAALRESVLQLFVSDVRTNRALDSLELSVKVASLPNLKLAVIKTDTGIYQLKGVFPANDIYDLQVSVNGALGADFMQVSKIEIGKKLQAAVEEEHSHWYETPWLWALTGLAAGILLMYILMKKRYRKSSAAAFLLLLLIPSAAVNPSLAHEGEEHGSEASKGGALSNTFRVEKESQFLFDIITEKTGAGSFYQSTELLGVVTASPQGLAVIQAPQTGKIVSMKVTPGQTVAKGQTLAVVEQQVEAGTQIDIISQRNTLNAEVKAAKAQYDRLLSIADIAAKKDVSEAKARYEAAAQNLQLFNANVGRNMGSSKLVSLTAPISGVVGTFNYAIGAVVAAGQTLFEITNLSKVYVETQVFGSTALNENSGGRFEAIANNDTTTFSLKLISSAQVVNTANQSQRVVFEVVNPNGKFKIGENVRVLQYGANRIEQIVIPTAALTDVNGKPAVFIKDSAEQYSISFVQKGNSNPLYTAIVQGVEAGERVVSGNVYQMKMIYLNQ